MVSRSVPRCTVPPKAVAASSSHSCSVPGCGGGTGWVSTRVDTPARVARAYAEQFSGLGQRPEDVLNTVFDADHDEMVLVRDIEMYATCEHHLAPFFGHAHVGDDDISRRFGE